MPTTSPLDQIPALAAHAKPLSGLGYNELGQLESLYRASPKALAKYLGISDQDLGTLMATVSPGIMAAPAALQPPKMLSLGARLTGIAPPAVALMRAPGLAAVLPPLMNMIDQMRPIRDQGTRGTCVAHAATAAAEHYFGAQGQTLDLSRQILYWDCKRNDGDPNNPGTWISVAMKCLASDGCCLEQTWPYDPQIIPGNESQDPPPANALQQSSDFRIPTYRQLPPTSLADIKGELAAGRCVAFSIPVYDSWYLNQDVQRTGAITNPIPGEQTNEGHAMCFVGYEDDASDVAGGGGHFILRNSWDSNWATASVVGTTGYGTIPYSYINAYCVEAYSIGV